MRHIVIHGIYHSGTSILKSLLGEHTNVYNEIAETTKLPDHPRIIKSHDFSVIKSPYIQQENTYHTSCYLITIIRNPYYTYNSLLMRFKTGIPTEVDLFKEYEKIQHLQRTKVIRYEDIFLANFMRDLCHDIGFVWNPEVLNKKHTIFTNRRKKIYGVHKEHNHFREEQINQKFENKNDINKLMLNKKNLDLIRSVKHLWQKYYPETQKIHDHCFNNLKT